MFAPHLLLEGPIEVVQKSLPVGARFSIVIPTWNNLPYLRLCVESLLKNSGFPHEIIIHVNDGTDGTLEWVKGQGLSFTRTTQNAGICLGVNAAAALARTDYLVYLNDDMYVLPHWDTALVATIDRIGHPRFSLSGTLIEPRATGNPCVLAPCDFGDSIETFREAELLQATFSKPDWQGSLWPPTLMPVFYWRLVGGYSTELSPGLYSDPDLMAKLYQAGVRHFQGVGTSLVYHFQAKSTNRVVKNPGRRQFAAKWGLSSRRFTQHVLRRGEPFTGQLPDRLARRSASLLERIRHLF
jgi:glycosyltransferase involved in cell wall biosynthesis